MFRFWKSWFLASPDPSQCWAPLILGILLLEPGRSRDLDTGLWLVQSDNVIWILASDWSRVITWSGYWPLIGQRVITWPGSASGKYSSAQWNDFGSKRRLWAKNSWKNVEFCQFKFLTVPKLQDFLFLIHPWGTGDQKTLCLTHQCQGNYNNWL